MAEAAHRPRIAVLDRGWGDPDSERAFVSRTVAGALACHGDVDVLAPGTAAAVTADGAFDVVPVGQDGPGGSPWPSGVDSVPNGRHYDCALVVGSAAEVEGALHYAGRLAGERLLVLPVDDRTGPGTRRRRAGPTPMPLGVTGAGTPRADREAGQVGFFLSVNPMAGGAPFAGVGCSDYVLVLAGAARSEARRAPGPSPGPPSPGPPTLVAAAPWLVARFPREFLVTVADGLVTVWRNRSPLGTLSIATRIDLWRLMAFARVTVDPRPGVMVARECIESLLMGTPIVVPDGGVAAVHAREGGGVTYGDVHSLLEAVERLLDMAASTEAGSRGRRYAEDRFAAPRRFVDAVGAALSALLVPGPTGRTPGAATPTRSPPR